MAFFAGIKKLFFQDVVDTMRLLGTRSLTLEDCQKITLVKKQIEGDDDWPSFSKALFSLRRSVLLAIIKYEKKSLTYMFFLHLFGVVSAVFGSLVAVKVLESLKAPSGALTAIFLALFVFVLNVAAAALHSQKLEREVLVFWRIKARLVSYLFRGISHISRQGRYQYKTGDLLNIGQTDTQTVASFLAHAFVDIPVLLISVTIIMAALYSLLGVSAWVPLVVICLQIPLSLLFSYLTSLLFKEYMARSDKRISYVTEFVQGMRLIRYFGWQGIFERDIDKTLKSQFRQEMKISAGFCAAFAQSSYWWMIVSLSVAFGLLYYGFSLSPEKVFGGMWLSSVLNQQLTPLPWFVSSYASAKVASKRIEGVFAHKQQEELILKEKVKVPLLEDITGIGFSLEEVSFRFSDSENNNLHSISLDMPPGSKTAIIGPVGAGKSLLSQLLLGEILPDSGRIMLLLETEADNYKIPLNTKEGLSILRSHLKWVPQEAFVVSATIRENVPLSYEDEWEGFSDNDIMNAMQKSQMDSDLKTIPGGLSAALGERGINLSGGQKQRLNLARGYLSGHKIMLLDDPFSAVDQKTEALLAPHVFSYEGTLVWITHRYDYLKEADQVVYLEDGMIQSVIKKEELDSFSYEISAFLNKKDKGNQSARKP